MVKSRRQVTTDLGVTTDALSDALAAFNFHYGRDEAVLEKWQQLCADCDVEICRSIKKCKAA
jgi:hypothetical protein